MSLAKDNKLWWGTLEDVSVAWGDLRQAKASPPLSMVSQRGAIPGPGRQRLETITV